MTDVLEELLVRYLAWIGWRLEEMRRKLKEEGR